MMTPGPHIVVNVAPVMLDAPHRQHTVRRILAGGGMTRRDWSFLIPLMPNPVSASHAPAYSGNSFVFMLSYTP